MIGKIQNENGVRFIENDKIVTWPKDSWATMPLVQDVEKSSLRTSQKSTANCFLTGETVLHWPRCVVYRGPIASRISHTGWRSFFSETKKTAFSVLKH